ncbi:hypothetical protein [Vibrio diabolicus]|uniref:hypothetical protein n=1 Tax=Vibrio diabolicus TaxID=50719 RepID=UPI003F86756B
MKVNPLVKEFLDMMEIRSINYVHWKSNTNIQAALNAEDDLDILVDKEHRDNLEEIFEKLSILKVKSYKDTWQSGITNYIGFDSRHNKLIHFHVHYSLPVGYDFDKNYVLPIERNYLANRHHYRKLVQLPKVEDEYILLVLRLILKNGIIPFTQLLFKNKIRLIKGAKSSGLILGSGYKEFIDLKSKISRGELENSLDSTFNFIPKDVFFQCEEALLKNNNLISLFKSSITLESKISIYRKNNLFKSFLLSFFRLNQNRVKSILSKIYKTNAYGKEPLNGGAIYAFVGGDGAGKSTTIAELSKTLIRHFEVHNVHVGRPRKSFTGVTIKIINKALKPIISKDLSQSLSYLALAYDRKSEFVKAEKLRDSGSIVLLDRIPLKGITTMDCPRIRLNFNSRYRLLSHLEEKTYERIKGVDKLFVLKLDPMQALERRPEDDPDELKLRSGQIWNNNWHAPAATVIDTGEKKIHEVQSIIIEDINQSLKREKRIVEVVGLNGVGKSTLIYNAQQNNNNMASNLPIKENKLLLFLSFLISVPWIFKAYIRTKNKAVVKNTLVLFSSVFLLEYWRIFKKRPSVNYLLDQGPFFQLSMMRKDQIITSKYFEKIVTRHLDQVVILQACTDVLWERVNQRQGHVCRGQELSKIDFLRFCQEYNLAFESISCENLIKFETTGIEADKVYQELRNKRVL